MKLGPRGKRWLATQPITCPFTVLIDTQENAPYPFTNILANAKQQHRPLIIPTAWQHLPTADYSVRSGAARADGSYETFEGSIVVERKSLSDLFSTLGQRRKQFKREHERMAEIVRGGGFAAVVIEAGWEEILTRPPVKSKLLPKVVMRTALSWAQRYGVHWIPAGGRRLGEVMTFRMLEGWWNKRMAAAERLLAEIDMLEVNG